MTCQDQTLLKIININPHLNREAPRNIKGMKVSTEEKMTSENGAIN
jgi:hypothetical protein